MFAEMSIFDVSILELTDLNNLLFFLVIWIVLAHFFYKSILKSMQKSIALTFDELGFHYYFSPFHETKKLIPFTKIQHCTRLSKTRLHIQFNEPVDQYIIHTQGGPVEVKLNEFKVSGQETGLDFLENFLEKKGFTTQDFGRSSDDFKPKALTVLMISGLILSIVIFVKYYR